MSSLYVASSWALSAERHPASRRKPGGIASSLSLGRTWQQTVDQPLPPAGLVRSQKLVRGHLGERSPQVTIRAIISGFIPQISYQISSTTIATWVTWVNRSKCLNEINPLAVKRKRRSLPSPSPKHISNFVKTRTMAHGTLKARPQLITNAHGLSSGMMESDKAKLASSKLTETWGGTKLLTVKRLNGWSQDALLNELQEKKDLLVWIPGKLWLSVGLWVVLTNTDVHLLSAFCGVWRRNTCQIF